MKKLLLTLLGAAALCGLSPHPVSAQTTTPEEKTVTFNFSATTGSSTTGDLKDVYENGLVAAGHRIKAVIPKYGDPTDFTIDTTDPVKTLTSAPAGNKSYGWGRIDLKASENAPTIHVDFDFSKCTPAQENPVFSLTNSLSTSLFFKKQDNNPGTAFSISLDKGKRIKSIKLEFNDFSYQNTGLTGLTNYLGFIKTISGFGSEDASSDYKTEPHESNKFFDYATYTATDPDGTDRPLYLQLIHNSDKLYLKSISVTYIEDTEHLSKFNNRIYVGKKYGTPILYKVEDSNDWIEAKGADLSIAGSKVYVKLGNAITEFTAPSTLQYGQPTVTINAIDYLIGTTLGCTFRSYLDNPTDKAYEVKYLISDIFPSGARKAYRVIDNITPCTTAFNAYKYAYNQRMSSEELYTVWNPAGLQESDILTAKATYSCKFVANATQKQKDGIEACVIFDGLELAYKSDDPCLPGTAELTLPKDFGVKTASGTYIVNNPGEAVITASDDPLFTSAKTYYILGNEALDATSFNKEKATYVDGQSKILIDGSKSNLAIRTYAIASDGETEVVSEVKNFTFEKPEVMVIEKASQLTANLNGKTVRLNFPVSVLASGTLGSDKRQYMIYARDPENNPVIMVSKVSEVPATVNGYIPGPAFKAPASNFIADVGFIPAGGAIGKVEVDEHGHVRLVIKDADGNDSFGLCFAGAPLKYNDPEITAAGIDMNYARKANTYLKINEIKSEQYGRMVWLRNVKYDETDGFTIDGSKIPFALKGGNEENPLFLESENGVYQMYSSTPSASENLSVCGIVEYDATKGYYLMVRNFIAMQPVPTVTPNSSQYSEFTENESKTEGTAYIKRTNIVPSLTVTLKKDGDNTTKFYYDFTDNTGKRQNVLLNTTTVSLSYNASLTIDDQNQYLNYYNHGVATLSIESHDATTNSAVTSVIPSDRSDAYTLTVKDNLMSADEYASMSDLMKIEADNYATVKTPYSFDYQATNSGTWPVASVMIAYIRGDYMLVRDVIRNDDTSLAEAQASNADFHLVKLRSSRTTGTAQYRTHYIYPEGNGDDTGKAYYASTTPREGDGIAKASGLLINENGNHVFDMTASYGHTSKNAFALDIDKYDFLFTAQFNSLDELFSAQLESLRHSSVIEKPDESKVGKESIGKIIEIKGAAVEVNTESGSCSITLGGVKRDLAWFDNDANATSHKSLIDKGGKFDISVYIMNNGNDDVELKVLTLIPQAQLIDICDHPHHATYYGKHSLDDKEEGAIVRLRGIKIFKPETDYYTTVGDKNIAFVWESLPDNQTNDINNITVTNVSPVNLYASTSLHEVTGIVKHVDDNIKLDVLSIKKTGVQHLKNYGRTENNIALYFDGEFQKFNTYNVPTVRLNNILDYKEMTVSAPEWSQVSYMVFSENGTALENPEWKPLASGESLKIDKKSVIFVSGCAPDHITQIVVKVEANMNSTLQETADIHQIIAKSNTSNYLHHIGKVRVAAAATLWPVGHIMAVTDDNGHYIWLQSNKYLPEVGCMMTDFALQTTYNSPAVNIGNINNNYWFRLTRDPEMCKYDPDEEEKLPDIEPIISQTISEENVEKYIRLIDIKIDENEDGSLKAINSSDEGNAISLNNIFDCEIAENSDDSKYILSGILMPKPGKSVPRPSDEPSIDALADGDEEAAPLTLDDMEFVPLSIEKKRPTAAATFEVTGAESREDNTVITIGDVTVSMACADEYSKIEYSTDGGITWAEYTQPLTISESTAFKVRTSAPGYDVNGVTLDIRREYYSAEAKVTPTAKGGYTEVVIVPATDLEADSYKIYYTTDGTEPTTESTLYTAPIESEKAASIRALVVENGKRPGKASDPVAVSVRAHDLEITPEKGEGFTTVTIAPKDPRHLHQNAEIRYTTDGSEPTAGSALYTAPFEVEAADNGMTVKAICIEPEKTAGQVAAATIAVEGLRPSCDVAITLTENSGTYYITLTAEAGDIWYRIGDTGEFVKYDGTPIEYTPTANGTYTVSAYALEEGKKAGKTATENIVVTGISGIGADGEADGVRVEGNAITVPEGAQTFDIAGRRVNPQGLSRGIYIVRLASGKAVKVVIR